MGDHGEHRDLALEEISVVTMVQPRDTAIPALMFVAPDSDGTTP